LGSKPVSGTLQLWIFLSCDNNGAIDMFARRVGRWEVMILLRLCEFAGNVQVLGGPPKSDEAQ